MRRQIVAGVVLLCCSSSASAGISLTDLMADITFRHGSSSHNIDIATLAADDGWSFEPDGAWGIGSSSTVRVLFSPAKQTLTLVGKPFGFRGAPAQWFEVVLNGQLVRRVRMVPWSRRYRVRLPQSFNLKAENQLTLRYRWSRLPTEVLSASTDTRELAVKWQHLELEASSTPVGDVQTQGGRLTIIGSRQLLVPLKVQGPATLTLQGLVLKASSGLRVSFDDDQLKQTDTVVADSESPVTVSSPAAEHQRFVRLTLQVLPPKTWWTKLLSMGRKPSAQLRQPTIEADMATWPTLEVARMKSLSEDAPVPIDHPPSVFLWVVDTLRADHLGLYGYPRATSPNLDAFASDAVTFSNAIAQSSWTRPSVTSIFTGQYLSTHGVLGKDHALAREAITLAESLATQGYRTAAFVTNGNLRHVGLEQGFGRFEHLKEGRGREFHRPADDVVDRLLKWLDRHQDDPTLLAYAHVTDPHAPYIPEHKTQAPWPTVDPQTGSLESLRRLVGRPDPPVEELVDLYDAEILQTDRAFRRFVDGLRQRGRLDSSILVITADHGEEFLDHGEWQHGHTLYSEQLRVPLVIRWPPGQSPYPAGSKIEQLVSHVDILPTILRTAGVSLPSGIQGRSLQQPSDRPTVAEIDNGLIAVVSGDFKLIANANSPDLLLFRRSTDPGDTSDLAWTHFAARDYLLRLRQLLTPGTRPDAPEAQQDAETLEQLRALGYLE